ncbi:MAG TPA: FKBP-type peptidyl-prolyl cis-trans isomerase N-terminal domain-containing protein [Syntrophales bacterium]|nr:FKBP-type peptidyl-prolyl cis-trans isomerase N-terminal domain-containing protein [Syntrophales bacterium]
MIKIKILAGFFGILGIVLMAGTCPAAEETKPATDAQKISYSIGYQIGGDFLRQGWELDAGMLTQGVLDAAGKSAPKIPPAQMNAILTNLKKKLVADQRVTVKQAEESFLAANAKKEGVVVLPDGVQYKVVKSGDGRQPTMNDDVTIRYRVSRIDQQEIPTGYPDAGPRTYPLKKALPGLKEVLLLMKEGAVWQVVLPPGPALGSRGEALENAGVLVYELELVSVQPGK